ncbi:MAG: PEP-CTERM sorting domain-containing protein [Bryobacterales bacterium]|nr:PEP-CTERM sorting domain-containing protein [Bryobacterales bacterium]
MLKALLGCVLCAGTVLASAISSVSVNNSTAASVGAVSDTALGTTMGAMVITASWGSDVQSCVYNSASASCSIGNLLTFRYVDPTDNTHPAADVFGHWEVINHRRTDLTSLKIDALAGNTVFDRCFIHTGSGGIAAQDSNATLGLLCAPEINFPGSPAEGTAGSNVGYSAAGYLDLSGLSASATYSVLTALGANPAVGDLYGALTLNFASGFRANILGSRTFRFHADTDLVSQQNDSAVPEPGTCALLLAGLAGLAMGRIRVGRK